MGSGKHRQPRAAVITGPGPDPVWLPGDAEVPVSGETFHEEAIMDAARHGGPVAAVLVPEPGNPHDALAVAVYLGGRLAGHLSRQVTPVVQPALTAFLTARQARGISCPARISWHEIEQRTVAQIVLLLDPAPLGLTADSFRPVPASVRVISRALRRLDDPAPALTGSSQEGRAALEEAEEQLTDATAAFDPGMWPGVELSFRSAAALLASACDPMTGRAFAGVAMSVRFQKGRRDDRIEAAGAAVFWDRENEHGWLELVDAASAAPHVPTLAGIFSRVPIPARQPVLRKLLSVSRRQDRLGNMRPPDGARLRAELAVIAAADGDEGSLRKLASKKPQAPSADATPAGKAGELPGTG